MKSTAFFLMLSFISITLFAQDTLHFNDNFDTYPSGDKISTHSEYWVPWSGMNAPEYQIASISDLQAFSQPNSLNFTDDNDIIYYFNDQNAGKHLISFRIWVEENYGAHINVQHEFAKNWAFSMLFREDTLIKFDNGMDEPIFKEYQWNTWHDILIEVDIDHDVLSIQLDGESFVNYPFRRSQSNAYSTILDCINFFGQYGNPQELINSSSFFIDDFTYTRINYEPPALELDATPIITNGENISLELSNTGELAMNYRFYPVYKKHPSFGENFKSIVLTHSPNAYPDHLLVGWQADKVMKYLVRFYPEDLQGSIGLRIDSIKTYIGEFLDNKAKLFLLDRASYQDKYEMGEMLIDLDFEDLAWNTMTILPVESPYTIQGQEFTMGIEAISPGYYNPLIPYVDEENPASNTYRNYLYNFNEYFDMPGPAYFKIYASGNAWPEWISIDDALGSIAPGSTKDFNIAFNTDELQGNNTYYATLHLACNDPDFEFNEIPVTLDVLSTTQNKKKAAFLIYPNPGRDFIFVQSDDEILDLSVFAENGRLLHSAKSPDRKYRIDLGQLEGNSFILKINTKDHHFSRKILKFD